MKKNNPVAKDNNDFYTNIKKENELQNVLIEEIKQSTSNPLGG